MAHAYSYFLMKNCFMGSFPTTELKGFAAMIWVMNAKFMLNLTTMGI